MSSLHSHASLQEEEAWHALETSMSAEAEETMEVDRAPEGVGDDPSLVTCELEKSSAEAHKRLSYQVCRTEQRTINRQT